MSSLSPTPEQLSRPVPLWVYLGAVLATAVGAVAVAVGLRTDPAATWRGLLVNFLYWVSLAQGAVMWAVVFRVARASWSAPINRLGRAFVGFLPVAALVFAALYLGRDFLLPWLHAPVGDRRWWLNAPFMWARDLAALVILWGLGLLFVRGYRDPEPARASRRLSAVGVVLLFAYGWLFSLLGFDLVQSLAFPWHSALFGWYFLLSGMYLGIAALIVTAVATRGWLGVRDRVGPRRLLDLGNLLLACAMLMTYFMFSQAVPIWYENLPPEVVLPIPRLHYAPWQTWCWVLLFTCYLGVVALLIVREMKEHASTLTAVTAFALAAMGLERYLLVVPSLAPRATSFPYLTVLMALGFLGMLVLIVAFSLARGPAESPLDLALKAEQEQWV